MGNIDDFFGTIVDITTKSSWMIWILLIVIVGGGVITNSILSIRLARRRLLPISLHLAIADISVLFFLAPYELIIMADGTGIWNFPENYCKVFLGMETLLGTAVVYLLILQNFSLLTGGKMSSKKELMIVWLLAVCISIPQFLHANVIPLTPEYRVCYIPRYAALLVAAFRACLPSALLIISLVLILLSFRKLTEISYPSEVVYSIVMSLSYLFLSEHRSVSLLIFRIYLPKYWLDSYRIPPLAETLDSSTLSLSLSGLHYFLSTCRPLICWVFCSRVRLKQDKHSHHMQPSNTNTYYSYPI